MIQLGQKVKDRISGFTGIVTARTTYLNNCVRIAVEPQALTKDGAMLEAKYFDEEQLTVIGPGLSAPAKAQTGGGPDPVARQDAPRR